MTTWDCIYSREHEPSGCLRWDLWEKLSGGCAVPLFQPDINRFMGTFCYCLQCMGEDEKALGILEAGFDRRLLHASGLGDHMELVYGSYLYELLRYHKPESVSLTSK